MKIARSDITSKNAEAFIAHYIKAYLRQLKGTLVRRARGRGLRAREIEQIFNTITENDNGTNN